MEATFTLPSESPSAIEEQVKCLNENEIPAKRNIVKVLLKGSESGNAGKAGQENEEVTDIELATKARLTEEDVKCPICWSILYEPTTLPCKHSLCMSCYLTHAEETSLNCPCCRRRLSIWSRKARKQNDLLDKNLWARLKREFPDLIQAKVNGQDSEEILSEVKSCSQYNVRDRVISSTPGMIFAELQQVLKPHQDDLDNERLRTEAASISFIKQIEEEERKKLIASHEREKQDFVLAKQLHEEFNGGVPDDKTLRKSTRERKPCKKYLVDSAETSTTVDRIIPKEKKLLIKPSPLKKQRLKKVKHTSSASMKKAYIPSIPETDSSRSSLTPTSKVVADTKIELVENTTDSAVLCTLNVADKPSNILFRKLDLSMDASQSEQKYNHATESTLTYLPDVAKHSSVLSYTAAKILCMLGPEDELIPPSDNEEEDYRCSVLKQAELILKGNGSVSFFDDQDSNIDYDEVVREADAVAARCQEQTDKILAESLQRKIKWGIDEGRGKDSENKYSLRAWKRTRTSENV